MQFSLESTVISSKTRAASFPATVGETIPSSLCLLLAMWSGLFSLYTSIHGTRSCPARLLPSTRVILFRDASPRQFHSSSSYRKLSAHAEESGNRGCRTLLLELLSLKREMILRVVELVSITDSPILITTQELLLRPICFAAQSLSTSASR